MPTTYLKRALNVDNRGEGSKGERFERSEIQGCNGEIGLGVSAGKGKGLSIDCGTRGEQCHLRERGLEREGCEWKHSDKEEKRQVQFGKMREQSAKGGRTPKLGRYAVGGGGKWAHLVGEVFKIRVIPLRAGNSRNR